MGTEPDVSIQQEAVNLSAGAQRFLGGRMPILFHVAEITGIGAHCEPLSFRRAILVLLDPVQSSRVGQYELHVFAATDGALETADAPAVQLPIGPSSRIAVPHPALVEVASHGLKDGPNCFSIQFHTAMEADNFARDFHVRSRVMRLSLRTAQNGQGGGWVAPRRSPSSHLWSILWKPVVTCLVLLGGYCLLLSKVDPTQQPVDVVTTALSDVQSVAMYVGFTVAEASVRVGTAACESITQHSGGSEPELLPELERCLALPENAARISCAEGLVHLRHGSNQHSLEGFGATDGMFEDLADTDVSLNMGSSRSSGIKGELRSGVENTTPMVGLDADTTSGASWDSYDF